MKIRKATDLEKRQYAGSVPKPVYPLFGYVTVEGVLNGTLGRWVVAVEYLGEGRGEPNYEAIAPTGMHFDNGDRLHTILGFTQADLLDHLGTLEVCTPACG